ncbi:recombination regulator RecX [Lacticaseibacillus daqingensis]|uniref:recombination regulator RecX n=1 Tax=Lacticaseibacillus daqingensis TaxID=2486014 RepID=UPI000F78B4DA|nr:recombination regulator RecX [Lacticaseibacillus daqingensis]
MKIITAISAQKRQGRYNIFVDGQYAFPVSESTLIRFTLAKGMELPDPLEAAIKTAEVEATANRVALDYLSHQMRSVHEVVLRLRQEELPQAAIAPVITRLKDLHYLDDARLAAAFARDNVLMGERGPKQVTARLREKGVAPATIDDALATITAGEWAQVAGRVATKAARRNARRAFHDQQQKIRLALMQKGFDADQSAAALADLALQKDEVGEADRLAVEAAKQWRQKARYQGYERRNRVKQALFRKGFALDDITPVLDALEAAGDEA